MNEVALLPVLVALVQSPSHALRYEREVVLQVAYGSEENQVWVGTPWTGAEASSNVGPDYFDVIGDTAIYIGDRGNAKVKRFRVGGGLEFVTEGTADCLGGFAVAEDGRIFARGAFGETDLTVFDRTGKKLLKTPTMIVKTSGTEPEWTGQRVADVAAEARAAGLYEPILKDASGRVYRCERRKGQPFKARFTTDDGSLEFEMAVNVAALPDSLKDVETVKYWTVDGRGWLYAVCASQKPEPKVILEWEDHEPLDSTGDVIVLVYEKPGVFLGGIRYDHPPAQMVSYYDKAKVMPNGNIYCYNYTAEGLQVVRYRPIEE